MGEITLRGYICERCSHEWAPRIINRGANTNAKPKVCPKCKSPYWNTRRKSEQTVPEIIIIAGD